MEPVEAVLIGAGNRGRDVYARWALAHPERLRITAVAEPDDARRSALATDHGLPPERVFRDWAAALAEPALAPVAIVATSDNEHVGPALAALARGYDLLLEKPIAPTPAECLRVVEAAEAGGRALQISHVLRYTPFYREVRRIVSGGALGDVVHVELKEHVAHWHMAHSYVRGRFRSRALAAPLLLAKSCHDLDLLCWLVGRPPRRVASFGRLGHFQPEAAPPGAPARCTDGCPVQERCPHDAVRFYLGPDEALARSWPWSDVSADPSREARRRALESGRYGRCVHRCDNDAVDHQVVALEFEGGATASFTVQGLAAREQRTVRISGTRGELRGVLDGGEIELSHPGELGVERRRVEGSLLGHYGGDDGLLEHFTDHLARGEREPLRESGRSALESHLLGFCAEAARESGRVLELAEFRGRVARAEA